MWARFRTTGCAGRCVQNDRMNVGCVQNDRMNVGCVQKDRVCRALRSE